jgi:hypothetical protein
MIFQIALITMAYHSYPEVLSDNQEEFGARRGERLTSNTLREQRECRRA